MRLVWVFLETTADGMSESVSQKQNERIAQIQRIVEARRTGDTRLLESVFSPDVTMRLVGRRPLAPFAGTYKGLQAVSEVIWAMRIDFEFLDVETGRMLIDGNSAGVHWAGTLRNRGTSKRADFEGFMLLVFEDDLVVEYIAFIDTAGLHQMLSED